MTHHRVCTILLALQLLMSTAIAFAALDNSISALTSQPHDRAFWRSVIAQNYVHMRSQANVLTQLAAMIARNDPANFPEEFQTALSAILIEVN